ncbi:MAG: septum formation initiator family protein [Myxococcota bacterium]
MTKPVRVEATDPSAPAPSWSSLGWLLPFGLLVLAIVAVPLRILDEEGLPRHRLLAAELEEVELRNEALAREVRALEREVEGLQSDPATIERIARDELGMVEDGELVFQF